MSLITISQAAEILGISERRIQQLCKDGGFPGAVKQGKAWRIPEEEISRMAPRYVAEQLGNNELKPLPVGVSGYIELVSNYYYVDKTLLIKDFIDTLPKVSLFTRPRRFGKTLNMDMIRVFFEKTDQDTSVFFKDKEIWACGRKYQDMQGKYPVIYLSFKDVKYSFWANAYEDIKANISMEYSRHEDVLLSEKCSGAEKDFFRRICENVGSEVDYARSLAMLSSMLFKVHGQKAVIIIDEYDIPIQQGYMGGYYEEIVGFMRNLFSGAFKDNPNLAYGFLTGILRVAKESIFSGLNNLKVNTILDDRYCSYFGFTQAEVEKMLDYYGASDKKTQLQEWYDGYRFGDCEIYNPWSVINYIDEKCQPKAFWQSTGNNDLLGDIIELATPDIADNLRRFMQGEKVPAYIDTDVIYPEIKGNPYGVYSFLLMAGYLRNEDIVPQDDGYYMCNVSIPNREISSVYAKEVLNKLKGSTAGSTALRISHAIGEKDITELTALLNEYLMDTVSFFDTGEEAFYHGLVLGLCAILNNRYKVRSNRESGLGRYDVQLTPLQDGLPCYIFEFKFTDDKKASLDKLAKEAVTQIDDKKYDHELLADGITNIIKIGFAFRGKEVASTL